MSNLLWCNLYTEFIHGSFADSLYNAFSQNDSILDSSRCGFTFHSLSFLAAQCTLVLQSYTVAYMSVYVCVRVWVALSNPCVFSWVRRS